LDHDFAVFEQAHVVLNTRPFFYIAWTTASVGPLAARPEALVYFIVHYEQLFQFQPDVRASTSRCAFRLSGVHKERKGSEQNANYSSQICPLIKCHAPHDPSATTAYRLLAR
jgi:hypothetical protein